LAIEFSETYFCLKSKQMQKKIYHLSTCSTCKRIIKELELPESFEFQDIKTIKISEEELTDLCMLAGSYEAMFSRRSRSYKALGLKDVDLAELDMRDLILKDYTFLKRPVIRMGNGIFIGNSPKEIERLKGRLKA